MWKLCADVAFVVQAWGFANIGYEPGEDFWQQVGQNAIYHIHDYSAQNIANGEPGRLNLLGILAVVFPCLLASCVLDTGSGAASASWTMSQEASYAVQCCGATPGWGTGMRPCLQLLLSTPCTLSTPSSPSLWCAHCTHPAVLHS